MAVLPLFSALDKVQICYRNRYAHIQLACWYMAHGALTIPCQDAYVCVLTVKHHVPMFSAFEHELPVEQHSWFQIVSCITPHSNVPTKAPAQLAARQEVSAA